MCDYAKGSNEKCDSRGIPLSEIENQEREIQEKNANMRREIKNTIDLLHTGDALPNATFYVICVTHYVHLEDDTYVPAEIGVCQFSLKKGIIKVLHGILPALIPSGLKCDALQHSEATHNLLTDKSNVSMTTEVFKRELKEFMSKESRSPLYTQNEFLESVQSIFYDLEFDHPFKIFSLDFLFFNMHYVAHPNNHLPESIISDMLTCSSYDYIPSIACFWHKHTVPDAVKYCARSYVQRWVFYICDGMPLKDIYDIDPFIGKHLPDMEPVAVVGSLIERLGISRPNERVGRSRNVAIPNKTKPAEPEVLNELVHLEYIDNNANIPGAEGITRPKNVISGLRGAWGLPSTVVAACSDSLQDFPPLGQAKIGPPYEQEVESVSQSVSNTLTGKKVSNLGLSGIGRGRKFNEKN